jgi:predicted membrane protein
MTKRGQQFLALFLIALGLLYMAANFFENIDAGALFWPLALILLGAVLIFRPKSIAPENAEHYFARDINLGSEWKPGDKEVRMFAGDIDIDLRRMDLSPGENHYWVKFFAGDITVDVPEEVGFKVDSTGFVVEAKIDGDSTSNIMTGYQYTSDNFDAADKKFILHTAAFAVDLKIRS